MGKRKGKCVKKNSVTKEALEPEHLVKAPHSFVIHRGHCSKDLQDLTKDFRKIMEPFTASQLKERKKNTIKDFLSVSGYLHVSHMMVFTETELGTYMRLARLPRGPTLTFRIHNVKLKDIRRCVLMNYNPSTKIIDMRHYVIRATPVGLNRGTKKVVQGKIPNLNRCKDMSEFFDKAGLLSESEFEDDPNAQVVLPQSLATRGAAAESRSAIRLFELGPRISFQLIKVEDGLMDGEVLFHELVEKTEDEKAVIKKRREERKRLKEKRKAQQEENVKRKQREKEESKQKALEGIKKKTTESQRLMELAAAESNANNMDVDGEDDDAEYYRKAVGAEPEKDLFSQNPTRKRKGEGDETNRGFKKMRLDKKTKKMFQKNQSGGRDNQDSKRFQNDQDGRKRFHKHQEGGRRNQEGGRKNQEGGRRNQKGGRRNEEGDRRKQGGIQYQDGGRSNQKGGKGNQRGGKSFNSKKKVFGGKINKFNKMGKMQKGKGKNRK